MARKPSNASAPRPSPTPATTRTVVRIPVCATVGPADLADQVDDALAALKRLATRKTLDGMSRYGIPSAGALGVAVGDIHKVAARMRKNADAAALIPIGGKDARLHDLAAALWTTEVYEARLLACFLDVPSLVSASQMDRWCGDFDSWAICDTACFHLFDRTPDAMAMVRRWANRRPEFERRASFALLASVSAHNKAVGDEELLACLTLAEAAASDERNFVKKGVSWALRMVGRRSPMLHGEALVVAGRLAESDEPAARWVGRDVLRDLSKPAVLDRLKARPARPKRSRKS